MTDTRLIQLAMNGAENAQKCLFERYFSYAMAIALRYMKSAEDSQEAVNDAFLKFFESLAAFDSSGEVKWWLRKIVINTCIDRMRVKKRLPIWVSLDAVLSKEYPSEDDHVDECDFILPVLRQLPPRYRAVFNLYVFEEYKHGEIAQLLGISEGTSKSNYARAKRILLKKLQNNRMESALPLTGILTSTQLG